MILPGVRASAISGEDGELLGDKGQRLPHPLPTKGHNGSPKKWKPVTPAMAAGLTDHVWTMDELLSFRVPPDTLW